MASNDGDLDAQIVAYLGEARNGEESGFTGLYRLLGGRVAGYLTSRGIGDVEDVTNEVFLGAFRNLGDFEGDGAGFRSWLFAIAWNKSSDWHRAAARQPPVTDGGDDQLLEIVGGDAEQEVFALESSAGVGALLATLTDDQRDVLMLRIVADLSLEQVAVALDKSIGSVKSLQHRALAALERKISLLPVSPDEIATNTEAR